MHIAIVHDQVPPDASPDDQDVLVQSRAVLKALTARGYRVTEWPVDLDLRAVARRLCADLPDCVFNLVESLGGDERQLPAVPALLEGLGVPYTGAPLQALVMTTNKVIAKRLLGAAGLPTPPFVSLPWSGPIPAALLTDRVILKPVWEHGSRHVDEANVIEPDRPADLLERLRRRRADTGQEWMAEQYVEGREFNLSLVAGSGGLTVLPPAEIVFEGYEAGRPRVVGYRAKWVDGSFEATHTVRRQAFAASDNPLLARLDALARRCWQTFGLRGYARVDFRVDGDSRCTILEVNANPCLSPDAGFAAALDAAGISFADAVDRIVSAAHPSPGAAR